jgi:S-adenosyl methyltransferase
MTTEDDQSQGTPWLAGAAPGWIDPSRPSVARLHDVLLGGKDNFQADRDVRDKLLAIDPEFGRAVVDVQEFAARVTRFLAGEVGVSQFLNLGPTLPIAENVHEVAQRLNREASMVYVAMDRSVLAHGLALLVDNDRTHMAGADFRRPRDVMGHEAVVKYVDLTRPVAVYHVGTLHHISDKHDPVGMVADYMAPMPSGSYLALAHFLDPEPGHELAALRENITQVLRGAGLGGYPRTQRQIMAMLSGLEILEPGLVTLADWWPDGPRQRPLSPAQRVLVGALARKP